MKNKLKDPHQITDVYHVSNILVDAATVTVTDLCENLSNFLDTHVDSIEDDIKKINTKKFNAISVGNGADGIYPVWVGVDKNSKVRKIFAETSIGSFASFEVAGINSWSWNKEELNDQFFYKNNNEIKRIKLFDINVNSGVIAFTDHGGNFWYEHHDTVKKALDEDYFKKNKVFQNNYPIGLYKFVYGNTEISEPSSFSSSKIHEEKIVKLSDYKPTIFTEFLSNLLDDECYPTKYIFQDYLENDEDHNGNITVKINDKKLSSQYLIQRLPKALNILKKQNKILFKNRSKEVHEIRKNQFENFIISIIKDLEPQEVKITKFGKVSDKKKLSNNKLSVSTVGNPDVQEMLYKGYTLKSNPVLKNNSLFPVKNGKYPCYLHMYPEKNNSDDDYSYNYIKIAIEGIEGCYLNKDKEGKIVLNKKFEDNPLIQKHIKNRTKSISLDQVDIRNSENLDILKKLKFVEDLELIGLKKIKNWNGLTKLENLKTLKLNCCEIQQDQSDGFFKNLYSLKKLENFSINDGCQLILPNKKKFPKNLFPKKLKSYHIDIREEFKNEISEGYESHKGYGSKDLTFLSEYLPNLFEFPNYEQIKTLEKLRLYNFFDFDQPEGMLFNYEWGFEDNISKINNIIKTSQLKDLWIYGYNFKKVEELIGTRFLDNTIKLLVNTSAKLNGVNFKTYKDTIISNTVKNTDTLIIIDDNCGYNKLKEIDDIQLIKKDDLEIYDRIYLNLGTLEFPTDKFEKYSSLTDLFSSTESPLIKFSQWGDTLLKENDYNHFFDKVNYNEYLVFVKKSFLDKNKKEVFNKIKYLYYYCLRSSGIKYDNPIFWKKGEKFEVPKSIKLQNLETLHLSCGRSVTFDYLEKICGESLKHLVIEDMLVGDFKCPKMPKLEKLLINYGEVSTTTVSDYNKKFSNFRNFANLKSLKELEIDIEYDCDYGVEFDYISKNLESIKIDNLHPKYTKNLSKLKSLKKLDIGLWNTKEKIKETDFLFLKNLKNIESLSISGGYHASYEINYEKLLLYISSNIKELSLSLRYIENNHQVFYSCLNIINKRFPNLEKLKIDNQTMMIDTMKRSNFKFDEKDFNFVEKNNSFYHKLEKLNSENKKYNIKFDLKKIDNLRKLKQLYITFDINFGVKILNENNILNMHNLKRVYIRSDLFSKSLYKKVADRQNAFFKKCKKLKKYKNCKSIYDLSTNDFNKYNNLDIKFGFGYYGESALDLLKKK